MQNYVQATVTVLSLVILSLAALGGAHLLKAFGISLSAFKVAGGMVLLWMGLIVLAMGVQFALSGRSEFLQHYKTCIRKNILWKNSMLRHLTFTIFDPATVKDKSTIIRRNLN